MVYGTADDKVQPLGRTEECLRMTEGELVIEVRDQTDHAFDEEPEEECEAFRRWLEGALLD
jgi:hypothetical protein